MTTAISHGQRWLKKGERVEWRVVGLDIDAVGLSGPGPCRSYHTVPVDELLSEWELLPDDEWKKKMDARIAAAATGGGVNSSSANRKASTNRRSRARAPSSR